jgi:hypothetical protein
LVPPEAGFICRKLDLAQVKGKCKTTQLYEVMGRDDRCDKPEGDPSSPNSACTEAVFGKGLSAAVLEAIESSTKSLYKSTDFDWASMRKKIKRSPRKASRARGVECVPSLGSTPSAHLETPHDVKVSRLRSNAELYERALEAYQASHFIAARDALEALLKEHPKDAAGKRLMERVQRYVVPGEDRIAGLSEEELAAWTGVTVMTDK